MLAYLLLSLNLLALRQVPAGSTLHVRLTTAIGSYESRPGSLIEGVLIAPVVVNGETLIPEGSTLTGTIRAVRRVGLGIVRETASLDLEFNEVTLPDGQRFPILTQVAQVENARERVARDGTIRGVRTTNSLSYRVSGYVRTVLSWQIHAQLTTWVIRTMLVQVPEPEIFYPAGVELALTLKGPMLSTPSRESLQLVARLTEDERADLEHFAAPMPFRAHARSQNRPSDLINVMFIGSREQISAAFVAAGWAETGAPTLRTHITGIRAVAERRGFLGAPMSSLLVNDSEADMSWQKSLNDMAKRHHIRIWKQESTWHGQDVWIAAATRDIDFAFLRPGQAVTHRIEENVDLERDKIAHDLKFTSCADVVDWWERPGVERVTRNATGDAMNTDARLAVIRLNDCRAPRVLPPSVDGAPIRAHGNKWQRILRRQILSARSDLLRNNIYWRGCEGTRWLISAMHRRKQPARGAEVASSLQRIPDRISWLW
jgi:hypothetical protein